MSVAKESMSTMNKPSAERNYQNIVDRYEKCCMSSFYKGSKIDEGSIVKMLGSLLKRIQELENKVEELQNDIPAENYY